MDIVSALKQGIVSQSAEETRWIAAKLAEGLPSECTLALYGELGVGKTTFVGGLAEAWKIKGPITSPTFTIFTLYHGQRTLLHLDGYRLINARQVEALMLEDFLASPYCLAIEWPERLGDWVPQDAWCLRLAILREKVHHLQLFSQKEVVL